MADTQPKVREPRTTNGSTSTRTAGHHVLVLAGSETGAPAASAILREQGSTAHCQVYYDDSLGANGPTLGQAVLNTVE